MKAAATFEPTFRLTPEITRSLLRIEAARTTVELSPVSPAALAHLRESARLASTHYSTAIEGNRLTERDVAGVLQGKRRVPGRERDEREVPWIAYFLAGMAEAVEAIRTHAEAAARRAEPDRAALLRSLDPRQRRVLEIFLTSAAVPSAAVAEALGVKDRTARLLCQRWVTAGFLVATDPSRKGRKYRLAGPYEAWVAGQEA